MPHSVNGIVAATKIFKKVLVIRKFFTSSIAKMTRCSQTSHITAPFITEAVQTMVECQRLELIEHSVVANNIRVKWKKLGRNVFVTSFLGHMVFLMLLTNYILNVTPVDSLVKIADDHQIFWMPNVCYKFNTSRPLRIDGLKNIDVCHVITQYIDFTCHNETTSSLRKLFLPLNQKVLLIMCAIMIVAHVVTLRYLHTTDLFALAVTLFTTWLTFPWIRPGCFSVYGLQDCWQLSLLTIFLAYVHMALLLEYAPGIGVYVLMMKKVSKRMSRVLASSFSLLIFAFAICLHMIVEADVRHKQLLLAVEKNGTLYSFDEQAISHFHGILQTITKTLLMFVGEYDMQSHFLSNNAWIPWTILFLRVIFGTIALINLLITLAAGEVRVLQNHAEAQHLMLQQRYQETVETMVLNTNCKALQSMFNILPREDLREAAQTRPQTEAHNIISNGVALLYRGVTSLYYDVLVGRKFSTQFRTASTQDLPMNSVNNAEEQQAQNCN